MRVLAGVIVVATVATPALSQFIQVKARLTIADSLGGDAADRYVETSIAVSPTNPLHLVTACNHHPIGNDVRQVFYGISTGGIANDPPFSETGFVPVPPGYPAVKWVDPMTAASAVAGDLFVGSIVNDDHSFFLNAGFAVWRIPAGAGVLLNTPTVAKGTGPYHDDKGLLAVGPYPEDGTDFLYLGFSRRKLPNECNDLLWWERWPVTPVPPASVSISDGQRIDPEGAGPAPFCLDRQGVGASPIVIRSGNHAGRVVVAYRQGLSGQFHHHIEWCYQDLPVAGSPNEWSVATLLTRDTNGEDVHGYDGMSIPGSFDAQNFPSTTLDPTNPDVVYIAFAGSPTASGVDQNVDLYVARIRFRDPQEPEVQLKRITDSMLGDEEGVDQFFPAITVDGFGGINIAYVQIPTTYFNPLVPHMRIMYTRMPNWATLPTPLTTIPLAPVFPVPHHPVNVTNQGIDEYISIASSNCLIYVSHFECEPEFDYTTTNVYVTRISVCPADTDESGLVDLDDVVTFNTAFATQTTAADINRDGACTPTDITKFFEAYTCGCGTP